MNQSFKPKLMLNNVEYLCLKIYANPGRSGRWYLRALHNYRFGTPGTGSFNALYFAPSGKYRDVLFWDAAPKTKDYYTWQGPATCAPISEIHLTAAGMARARKAAAKLGLQF